MSGTTSLAAGGVAVGLSPHVAALRAANGNSSGAGSSLAVQDPDGLLPTLRCLSIRHYVTVCVVIQPMACI
jgi:hypothetical protein